MAVDFANCSGMEVETESIEAEIGELLGEGAEGAVYELKGNGDLVVKIFKAEKREPKSDKLERMVKDNLNSPSDQPDHQWTTWPLELVSSESEDDFLGYVMPYLDTTKYIDAQRYASQELRWEKSTKHGRYKPAVNLVLTVYWLHQNGYAIGDLSEQNIRIHDGNVTLIDCDSYSIEGSDFHGQMEGSRYTPPEGRGTSHEEVKQTDKFGVAVHIFQFLMAGFHPFQAVGKDAVDGSLPVAIRQGDFPYGSHDSRNLSPPPQAPKFERLPSSIRHGFNQCFSKGQYDPTARPKLQEWLARLSDAGEFDIEGINTTDLTINNANRDSGDSNWQAKVRQSYQGDQSRSIANDSTSLAEHTGTGVRRDTHWADEIRGEQTSATDNSGRNTGSRTLDPVIIMILVFLTVIIMVLFIAF